MTAGIPSRGPVVSRWIAALVASALSAVVLTATPGTAHADPRDLHRRERAEACAARRDHACVIALLRGAGQTEVELWLLIQAYRSLEWIMWRTVARRYIAQYANTARARMIARWLAPEPAPPMDGGDPGIYAL